MQEYGGGRCEDIIGWHAASRALDGIIIPPLSAKLLVQLAISWTQAWEGRGDQEDLLILSFWPGSILPLWRHCNTPIDLIQDHAGQSVTDLCRCQGSKMNQEGDSNTFEDAGCFAFEKWKSGLVGGSLRRAGIVKDELPPHWVPELCKYPPIFLLTLNFWPRCNFGQVYWAKGRLAAGDMQVHCLLNGSHSCILLEQHICKILKWLLYQSIQVCLGHCVQHQFGRVSKLELGER